MKFRISKKLTAFLVSVGTAVFANGQPNTHGLIAAIAATAIAYLTGQTVVDTALVNAGKKDS